jgi:hypothetical protein
MEIHQPSFFMGFVIGFLFSGYLGWVLQRIRQARIDMATPDRPMTVPTQRTPRAVMTAAAAAFWRLVRWLIVLLLSIVVGILLIQLLIQSFS